ncbi:ParB/RepB/Spo0J family partition protein [Geodermatophilus sp. DF01-2]|uniref:ParB/RepB/Spo0J family partition protein n=1 Tax=Geodermatophilus sp. DF01-2 TaxID=2559610 RepID=UPI00143019FB|nr:ParB/RepB/Spo0J family partition protein [Geodermatophilus sp. DF01_2]
MLKVVSVQVDRIRPEEGLDRKRDREGHKELRDSIQQFGVLTPVTVRLAPDESGDYLLIKGQGRTLACRMLGLPEIPAVVVDDAFADNEKVQQFLVENVARLRMRPIDRAMLIARARQNGEETAEVARRFGVSSATVRRLEAQLEDAGPREVAVLKEGNVNLTLHAVIARFTEPGERGDVVAAVAPYALRPKEMQALFTALGWPQLVALGSEYALQRIALLQWACQTFVRLPVSSMSEKMRQLAAELPLEFLKSSRTGVVM